MFEKRPIEVADVEAHVVRDSTTAFLFMILVGTWTYWLLPQYITLPIEPIAGLLASIQLTIIPLTVLLVSVLLVSTARRRSATDGLGSAYSTPSQAIAFKTAYLQNSLEQTVLFVGALLIGGIMLSGDAFSLLYGATFLFLLGRISFYFGYRKHPLRRAFGMSLTLLPTIILYAWFIAIFFKDLILQII